MKQIIDIYGRFLLDVAIVVLLVVLLFSQVQDENGNQGVIQIIGARIDTTDIDYAGYTDFDTYVLDSVKEAPVITYTGSNAIRVGTRRLSDYIKAADYAGSELLIHIISVTSSAGVELACSVDTDVEFAQAGIYTVRVKAVDGINKKTVSEIQIPVNN